MELDKKDKKKLHKLLDEHYLQSVEELDRLVTLM